jgi:hypothetical protein
LLEGFRYVAAEFPDSCQHLFSNHVNILGNFYLRVNSWVVGKC